jgi:hypothetical protein
VEKVKKLVEAGATVPGAIKDLLSQKDPPLTIESFSDKHGLNRTAMSEVINLRKAPTDPQVAALISEFGGTEDECRHFLWEAARPVPA